MIAMIGASAILLTGLQASINAPTEAFRGCLKSASAKASETKVAPEGIEDFFKAQCTVQMDSLKSAVVAFRVKNGMARKAALADATMTVEDYMAAPADKYRFMAELNAQAAKAQAPKPAQSNQAQATPAAQPKP